MTFRASHLYGNGPESHGAFGVAQLPLTTVAHIISFLDDDVASLARLCRTSRVLWYMTLPHLWKNVTLKSYNTIRYNDDVPEGMGSASPFSMGLNALVTRNVAGLVRSLGLEGGFAAADLVESARVGRVPESIMMLNIAVRAALDQCSHLESFRWDLDARIQPNVYAGLVKISRLESLWLRLPQTRAIQPAYDVPPMPNLKSLTFTHYDPLCFPDDLSNLLLAATGLRHLRMHFSPRMRDQGEPSVNLSHIFRKNISAKKRLRLKSIGIYNLFNGADPSDCLDAIDSSVIESFTTLNTFGVDEDVPVMDSQSGAVRATHFVDRTWLMITKPADAQPSPKSIRLDQIHRKHAQELANFAGLERLYLVNARHCPKGQNGVAASVSDCSPESVAESPYTKSSTGQPSSARGTPARAMSASKAASLSLRDLYLDNICNVCGPTLKHLILPARWPLPTSVTARLIRSCPNLTQLAVAIECLGQSQMEVLRLLVPFLAELWAIRILSPGNQNLDEEEKQLQDKNEKVIDLADCVHEQKMASTLAQQCGSGGTIASTPGGDFPKLKYIGLGWKVWEVGPLVKEIVAKGAGESDEGFDEEDRMSTEPREEVVYKRRLKRIEEKDVQHVEIWKMDSQDIV